MTFTIRKNITLILTLTTIAFYMPCCQAAKQVATKQSKVKTSDDIAEALLLLPDTIKWEPALSSLPEGASMAILEGNPKYPGPFTIRLKLPADYALSPHWHPSDEHITLISGAIDVGFQDIHKNKLHTKNMTKGSYIRIPARMHSFLRTTEDSIVQLHGQGPWETHFLPKAPIENKENS